jgi:hypothetical protein
MTTPELDGLINTQTNGAQAFAVGYVLGYLASDSIEPDVELFNRVLAMPPVPNTVDGRAALTEVITAWIAEQ